MTIRRSARVSAGPEIERLIQLLARLPGLGPRSARRAALIPDQETRTPDGAARRRLADGDGEDRGLQVCGNIDTPNPCTVCTDARRDGSAIVVVADVADLWALERAHAINARYHVLGGTLSPLDGVGPDDLTIGALVKRAHEPAVQEIILALNATVDGQSTAHYITDLLARRQCQSDTAGARRPGRGRARLSRRRDAGGGHAGAGRRFKGQAAGLPAD